VLGSSRPSSVSGFVLAASKDSTERIVTCSTVMMRLLTVSVFMSSLSLFLVTALVVSAGVVSALPLSRRASFGNLKLSAFRPATPPPSPNPDDSAHHPPDHPARPWRKQHSPTASPS
jgi:hypothetical protein